MRNFIITGLPRSGTAWLSVMMTCGPSFCYHELSGRVHTVNELEVAMTTRDEFKAVGNSDSAIPFHLGKIHSGDCPLIIVRREIHDCARSIGRALGRTADSAMRFLQFTAEQIEAHKSNFESLEVAFEDLGNEIVMHRLWDFATQGIDFPSEHFHRLRDTRITVKDEVLRAIKKPASGLHRETLDLYEGFLAERAAA